MIRSACALLLISVLIVQCGGDKSGDFDMADTDKAKADLLAIKSVVDTYLTRTQAQELPTWEMLITPDERGDQYLDGYSEAPRDPWGNEYEIRPIERGTTRFEILCWGPDGHQDTEDDITSRFL